MKAKRKIFDAVDMLTEESSTQTTEVAADGMKMLPVDKIRAFHDHPFHLYEGERLNDMVESIKEHGVLTPVIVQKVRGGYEMLSGHNRANAARYLRLNHLIRPFKDMMDRNEIPLLAAVDVSYMPDEEQQALYDLMTGRKLKLTPKMADRLRKESGDLDEKKMLEILD